nr:TSUP family transporter [Neorhizobium sp. JUb45]
MQRQNPLDIAAHLLIVLFFVAILAGFVDSIAGGGGLITIPSMLIAGIPPLDALGTNKLQGMFGATSATISYARRGHVQLKTQLPMALMALIGGGVGALIASVLPTKILGSTIPFLLIAIGLFFALKPNLTDVDSHRRITPFLFGATFVPLIGLYDGVFGPGAGSFYMLGFVLLAGFGMLKATAHTKLINLGSNVGGFLMFLATGSILWKVGIVMGVGQFIGAQIGSSLAMRIGAKIIKPLLVISCFAMATKLLADPSHPFRIWLGW